MSRTDGILTESDENRARLIGEFVQTGAGYYARVFKRIGDNTGFTWSFNVAAALSGSMWFGIRSLWSWFLVFVVLETFAVVQIVRGLFGDLASAHLARLPGIERTLAMRYEQLETAKASGDSDQVETFENAIASLERAADGIRTAAQHAEASAIWLVLGGIVILLAVKLVQGTVANAAFQKRYTQWRSDRTLKSGINPLRIVVSAVLTLLIQVTCALKFGGASDIEFLNGFPTHQGVQSAAAEAIKTWMSNAALNAEWFFDGLVFGIRTILDGLEVVFTQTPWPVTCGIIILLTGLSAGWRTAVFSAAALAYLGYLGFWDKSMKTLALLGTAAGISISLGIPLGILCARRPGLYTFVRPVLDFMQTMPAFVYLIPVIAFFGTGKPAAIVATMIFGGSPVVRLTVLGLRGVPASVREAAMAFGASRRYLLWKVDLPLAMPSIMAGINQTILLSLAMVVIASLIGAKGLGEDVLEALQYASEGQGILAGFAILFCAMILDRIIQGKRR